MKRGVLLAAFSIILSVFALSGVSATYCTSNAQCPATYSGAYCWLEGSTWEVWDYQQNRFCDREPEVNMCDDNGDPVDHKVATCSYGCSNGACTAAPSCTGGQTTGSVSCSQAPTQPNTPNVFTTGSCDGTTACQYACPSTSYYESSSGSCEPKVTGVASGGSCDANHLCGSNLNCGSDGTCHSTTAGSVGGSCTWWGTCQSGLHCTDASLINNQGTCQQWDVAVGGSCDTNRLCDGSGTCSSGVCKNYNVAAGGSCDTNNLCANSGNTPGSYTCSGGVCTEIPSTYSCTGPQASGSSICPGDDSGLTANTAKSLVTSCTSGTKCEYTCSGTGKYIYGGSCYSYQDDGESCSSTTSQCEPGHVCSGGICYSNCGGTEPTGTGVIKGSNLYDSNNDNRVGSDSWTYMSGSNLPGIYHCQWQCNTGYYQNGNTCSPQKANGQACTANNQCTGGTCNSNSVCSGGTPTCDATNCNTWGACSGGSKSCSTFNSGCNVPSTTVTTTCTVVSSTPTINSFSITPSTVTEGTSVTFSGSATAGSSCVTRHRARVSGSTVPSDGGWTTVSGCPSTITLGENHPTAENPLSFYDNPRTYTVRWELETISGQTTYQDRTVTINSGSTTCTPETDTQFCARLGKNCGTVTAGDNCGISRTVNSCGTCTSGTCGGSGTANICGSPTVYSCTGNAPGNSQLCNNDDQGLNADTPRVLASSCSSPAKCQYTCTAPYVYSGSGSTATCILPSSIATVEWKNLQGGALTQADLNDRVVMRAAGNGFAGKKVVFTLYKKAFGFDDKLGSFAVTPSSDIFATYNTTISTSGQIYFKANVTADDYVTSAEIPVSSTPNNFPPVAIITAPVAGGIYFIGNNITFDHGSTDADSNITNVLWTFGDGGTNTSATTNHSYTTPGQKTITLRVTDEQGATASKQISILVSASPAIFAFIEQPAHAAAVVSNNLVVDYSARQSYLVNVTYTGTTPCIVTVACLAGPCPLQTQQSPTCAANPNALLNVVGGGQANFNFNTLLFNWTFREGNSYLTPDVGMGRVSGTKGFSNYGPKNITLQLRYTPTGSSPIQSTYARQFTLFNQRQCSPQGDTWYSISNGFVTGTASTLDTAACAGEDRNANTIDDCCPTGWSCSTDAASPGCKVDNTAQQGCASYSSSASCTTDASQRVKSDILWSYPAYNCGKSINGKNYACSCAWTGSACVFNASSRADDAPITGTTTSCTYTSTVSECVSGYQSVTIQAQSNNVGNDPLCVDSVQTIPCGRPVVALPFIGFPQIIVAIILIAIIYVLLSRQRNRKRRR
jgi:hypothetical protein